MTATNTECADLACSTSYSDLHLSIKELHIAYIYNVQTYRMRHDADVFPHSCFARRQLKHTRQ